MINRFYGDLPVGDSDDDLRMPLDEVDKRKGVRGDPAKCAVALGLSRYFGATAALVFKTVAYVDILGEDGVRRVERFKLSKASQATVEAFDRGEPIPADGRALVLKAPSSGERLDAKLKRSRRREKALKGDYRGPAKKPRPAPKDMKVRNGSGQWQMRPATS
jgi:hypothetical protein